MKTNPETGRPLLDITGRRYGMLEIVERVTPTLCLCRCDCGGEKIVPTKHLHNGQCRGGRVISCGCLGTGPQIIDLTGQQFGRWRVLRCVTTRTTPGRPARWLCRCECGTERDVAGTELRRGASKSCGCAPPAPYKRRPEKAEAEEEQS